MHDTVAVLKACRSRAVDAGVKIAVENHAGDMQSHEIVALVEEAGKDYVGINFDSGNAVWTMEDPVAALEAMAPYVVTTSLRDSAIWESERGATVQWTAMGDGVVDLPRLFDRFVALCAGVPVHIETISGGNREFAFLDAAFWAPYAEARGAAFARFLALAKRGKPRAPWTPPPGRDRASAERDYQRAELERSIRYCKQALGLGLQA
jgi:sugar phosphate isomerase/epimerase